MTSYITDNPRLQAISPYNLLIWRFLETTNRDFQWDNEPEPNDGFIYAQHHLCFSKPNGMFEATDAGGNVIISEFKFDDFKNQINSKIDGLLK